MNENFLAKLKKSELSIRDVKKSVKQQVDNNDYNAIKEMNKKDKRALSALIALSYDKSNVSSWRALHMAGRMIGEIADEDKQEARGQVQRLIWNSSDESGTIPWTVPEILGEVYLHNPKFFDDLPDIILGYSHSETGDNIFLSGTIYAFGRFGEKYGDAINEDMIDVIKEGLTSEDREVCVNSIVACKRLNITDIGDALETLKNRNEKAFVYYEDELQEITISEFALRLLDKG
ncbi:hypothetical protein MCHI_003446 [Candidatus Magnetoovum chiemensis]|nr:hypothetical protein MCHI_003446 [Candidatus Magnetoovum chiemensis]